MASKKTVLKVTPNAPAAQLQKLKRKTDYLSECIATILKRELLHLNVKKVFDILVNDLRIDLKNVTPRMKYVLSECLCYYMKMWPGWQKYDVVCTNERAKAEYIEKFKEYLVFKITYIIENEKVFTSDTANKKKNSMQSKEMQTDPINKKNKPEAPYNLVISGQPNVLNNIVFIEMDENIVIKQHAEKPWKPLNVAEFLNYSFVDVSIKLPDLELSRSNLHEFQRYITECGDTASAPEVDFITYIRKRNPASNPLVFTVDYIHAYCKQFIEMIKKIPGVNVVKITELEEVFRQFILDIQESNVFSCTNSSGKAVNTMATDTSVCFNIGKRTYIRNKKMVVNNENQKETNAINFCEVLIPRMAYTLGKFKAQEDPTTEDTTFKSLNDITAQVAKNAQHLFKFVEAVNSSVTYYCLLCPKGYCGEKAYIDILDHYRFLHKGEQSVLCFSCRKQFAISKLAGNRWAHDCEHSTEGSPKGVPPVVETTRHVLIAPKPSIGIKDILNVATPSNNTISIDDLVNNQGSNVTDVQTPSILKTSNIVTNSNTIINTFPIVTVPTTNTVLPGNSVLLAIAPSSFSTNLVTSTPITIASNPMTIASNPAPIPSNLLISLPSNPVASSDLIDTTATIKDEIDLDTPVVIQEAEDLLSTSAIVIPPESTAPFLNTCAYTNSLVLSPMATVPVDDAGASIASLPM